MEWAWLLSVIDMRCLVAFYLSALTSFPQRQKFTVCRLRRQKRQNIVHEKHERHEKRQLQSSDCERFAFDLFRDFRAFRGHRFSSFFASIR